MAADVTFEDRTLYPVLDMNGRPCCYPASPGSNTNYLPCRPRSVTSGCYRMCAGGNYGI